MKRIVAIGGGEINQLETLAIDKEIVRLANKENAKVLFIPTASGDAEAYSEAFHKLFKDYLGCSTDVLYLSKPSDIDIRQQVLSSDIIYVGGGNTKMMMDIWYQNNLDQILKEAYENGILLTGMSAGSICWFDCGQSDTEKYEEGHLDNYISVNGLALLKGIHAPHYNESTRSIDFNERVKQYKGIGIAIDNKCAIEFTESHYRVIKSDPKANAYKIYYNKGQLIKELLKDDTYYPIDKLYSY